MIHSALDQAVGLRHLMRPSGARVLPVFGMPERVSAIVNLATALSRAGQQVLVIDASRGELAPAFGLSARYELKHVLEGDIALGQAVLSTRDDVQVLPAARGMRMLSEARISGMDFFESLSERMAPLDLIIVNSDAEDRAVRLLPAHGEAMLVLSRGPQVVMDAAACLKSLSAQQATARFRVLLLRTAFDEARATVNTLARLAYEKFGIELTLGGNAPPDRRLWEASRARRTLFDIDPSGPAARSFHNTAAGVVDWELAVVTPHAAAGAAHAPRTVTKLH